MNLLIFFGTSEEKVKLWKISVAPSPTRKGCLRIHSGGLTDKGGIVTSEKNGERKLIEAAWVILALGSRPAKELADNLLKKDPLLCNVRECQQPWTILAAVYEGAFSALQI